ncbi:Conserved_hypothetical protein [Hexamita inflata]|uniref:Uncharacterized protein n=1 Tax=Hexamita inflata TaxID=28002 RepID=A0AA86UFD5_9EUKA|nr:Conserved hypothetical protein [Hexamita inflata]
MDSRKAFFKNLDLSQVKAGQRLFGAFNNLCAILKQPTLQFTPTQVNDEAVFILELHEFLKSHKLKLDLKQLTDKIKNFKEVKVEDKQKETKSHSEIHKKLQTNFLNNQKIVGESTEIDKVFSRAAEVPDPSTIRTPSTLKTASKMLQSFFDKHKETMKEPNEKFEMDENYLYLQTRLRACRYDFQVQKIVDKTLAKILLINVQAAILAKDRKEFFTVIDECTKICYQQEVGNIQKLRFFKVAWYMGEGSIDTSGITPEDTEILQLIKKVVNNEAPDVGNYDRYQKTLCKRIKLPF